jgi:hypothetical protein
MVTRMPRIVLARSRSLHLRRSLARSTILLQRRSWSGRARRPSSARNRSVDQDRMLPPPLLLPTDPRSSITCASKRPPLLVAGPHLQCPVARIRTNTRTMQTRSMVEFHPININNNNSNSSSNNNNKDRCPTHIDTPSSTRDREAQARHLHPLHRARLPGLGCVTSRVGIAHLHQDKGRRRIISRRCHLHRCHNRVRLWAVRHRLDWGQGRVVGKDRRRLRRWVFRPLKRRIRSV